MDLTKQDSIGAQYTVARGIGLGVAGGLAGMIAMDIVMVVEFLVIGLPPFTYLEMIGSVLGGGAPLGVILHILLSIVLGLIFIMLVYNVGFLHIMTIRKGFTLGVLVGAVTIVGCIPFAIITGIPIAEILGFSSLPHIVFGAVCGIVMGYGLRE